MTKKRNISTSLKSVVITLFCLMITFPVFAQLRTVNGTVVDNKDEAIIGASVRIAGTDRGSITDTAGKFTIEAAPNEKITVSYLGYANVVVAASGTKLQIVLQEDTQTLGEVVVTGYGGTRAKETLTGAISAVSSKEITITKNENVVNMLSGKLPGVRISQRSAQPGEFDNLIDIRGMGTPLIVVDGIPRDKDYFSRMDANEIENVSVLKDASAAIYGVRAANGVLLVTTKRGASATSGKFDITFSTNFGLQTFLYVPQTASATDHMLLINEKEYNRFNENYMFRQTPRYSWDQILEYSSGQKTGTIWTDELFDKISPQQQHNLTVNGSSDKIDYFFNLGYMEQIGSYKSGSLNYDRWNFRGNVDARITDRLKASINLSGYMDERNQPHTDIWAVYKKAWTYRPTSQAWVDGDHNLPSYDSEMLESENPVASTDSRNSGYRQVKRTNFNGSLALTYDIPGIKGLNAHAFYSYDHGGENNTDRVRTYYLYNRQSDGTLSQFTRNDPGRLRRQANFNYGTVMQLSLNYANKFDDHNVSAMVLFEEQYNFWDNFYAQRFMFFDNNYLFSGSEEDQIGGMDGAGDVARQGIVGRAGYDFKGRYLIDYAFRYDGSSRFPKGLRWGLFQTVSVAWRLSEEQFMKNLIPDLTNLKLRASIGKLGDDGDANTYPSTVVGYDIPKPGEQEQYRGWIFNNSLIGSVNPTAIPNPDLTWYTATTTNLGVDFNLWNSKIYGTFEVFRRHRKGLLRTPEVQLPGSVGAKMPQINSDSDETFGWEIELGHRNRIQGVNYYVTTQFSATKNRWDYHLDSPAGNSMENWRRRDVSGRNKDIWFAYEEAGRFTSLEQIRNYYITGGNFGQGSLPGDYYYEDWNGDGVINDEDRHPVATYRLPTFNFGITMGADWRGLDLSMNWQGSAGVYNEYSEIFTEVGPFNGGAVLDMYLDRWRTENTWDDPWHPGTKWIEGYYPATGRSFNSGTTGIKNTSYIRMKTLELGYTLPSAWMKKAGIKGLRIYGNAYNLLTFSGMKYIDPERPGTRGGSNTSGDPTEASVLFYNYPVNRVFNFGAVLKF